MRVLMVCPDEQRAAGLLACLRRLGHPPVIEPDPARAQPLHTAQRFDVVVSDWDAPGGEQVTLDLAQAESPPILLALTGRAVERAQSLLAAGAPFFSPDEEGPPLELRLSVLLQALVGRTADAEGLRFLAEASAQLSTSLELDATLRTVARLSVLSLADYCVIDLVGEDGAPHRAEVAGRDSSFDGPLAVLRRHSAAIEGPLGQVMRSGRAIIVEDRGTGALPQFATSDEHLRALADLGGQAGVIAPLVSRGRVEGILTLVSRRRGQFGPRELALAKQLGERAGAALANARLHRLAQTELEERRRAEEKLRRSEEQFRALAEATFEAVVIHEAGEVLLVNRAMAALLGGTVEEMLGQSTFEYIAPECHETVREMFRSGRTAPYETLALHKDGTRFPIEVQVREAHWQGRMVRMAAMRDVRERKRLQARIVLADRLAAMGTLAAGVAHEINNPLAFVTLSLEFARLRLLGVPSPDAEIMRALEDASAGAQRVSRIVRDLKTLSRADDEQRSPVDVRTVLEAALGVAENELRQRARVVRRLGPVPLVEGSESRLGQVFLNLLVNAAQAIDEGSPDSNEVRVETGTHPSGRALIEVEDTGRGIAPEVRPRIFDPFFTTKPVGVGTGLGLSICHGIVTGMGGEIEVESAPGKRTVFRVLLPAAVRTAPAPQRAPEPLAGRRARVLLVDDEPRLRASLVRLLEGTHEVTAVGSGVEALEHVGRGEQFDAVLCDVMMPGMGAPEVHAALEKIAPDLARRTLFLTGGAFTSRASEFLASVPNVKLEKPFDPRALLEALRKVTGGA